jgi:hypothetical protein
MLAWAHTWTMRRKRVIGMDIEKILRFGGKALAVPRLNPISLYGGLKNRELFRDVETYCTSIGYSRSGKTLTSSLLDAHPNMIVADEVGAFLYIYAGFSRRQIYYLLLENSRAHTQAGQRSRWYSLKVRNQWQGKFKGSGYMLTDG